jgi:RHS repeat-associated protein
LLRLVEGDTEKTSINGSERTITNGTDDDGKSYVQNGKAKITSDTDDFGRTTKVNTKLGDNPKFSVNYTYKNILDENDQPTNRTTNNVGEMTYKLGDGENATQIAKYKYSYDSNGNITEVWDGNNKIAKYQYDSLNQLKVAWDYQQLLKFYYNYDNSGNIESSTYQSLMAGYEDYVTGNPHSANYYYRDSDWGDLLTEYKGTDLTYDNIGNPTSYRDGMEMTWSGRELKSLNKSGYTYNFTYNLDGLRTKREKKQGDTVLETVNFYYDDSNNLIGLKKGETNVLFYYDSEGKVYSMTKGDDTYFFIKNLQGDVTKIIDENGTVCATYAYDAWGGILATLDENGQEITDLNHIAFTNPFRYRGYVYDTETELYYLQSRYYDPKIGRFVNADAPNYTDTYSGSPLSTNMFAYCENNAVNNIDGTGEWFHTVKAYKKYILKYKKKYQSYSKSSLNYWKYLLLYENEKYFANIIRKKYKYNKTIELFDGFIYKPVKKYKNYIYEQNLDGLSYIIMGDNYRLSDNGCGIIALYNALKYSGKWMNLARVLAEVELNNMLWLGGFFGMKDTKIPNFFKAHKLKCVKYEQLKDFKKAFKKSSNNYKVAIIYITRSDYLHRHYYCIVRKNDKFKSLNQFGYGEMRFKNFDLEKMDIKHFIRAFCIKK